MVVADLVVWKPGDHIINRICLNYCCCCHNIKVLSFTLSLSLSLSLSLPRLVEGCVA
jgi:hypothetical protein